MIGLTIIVECDDDAVHITSIMRSKTGEMTTVTETCPANDYPEACAHYYSAIHEGGLKDILTCEDDEDRSKPKATQDWKRQHNRGNGWKAFTKPTYLFRGEKKEVSCQADEWPPAYFLPNDKQEMKKPEWGQLIRWLPSQENGQAANTLWAEFCKKYDGGKGNGQRLDVNVNPGVKYKGKPEEQVPLQRHLVDLGKIHVESRKNRGTWTYTTNLEEVTFTRAIMTMTFDYNEADKPKSENDWYLFDNPCWPKHIVPNDPGFVLLTDDKWYGTHQFPQDYDADKTKALYSKSPPRDFVQQAELRQKNSGEQESGDKRGHQSDDEDGKRSGQRRWRLLTTFLCSVTM